MDTSTKEGRERRRNELDRKEYNNLVTKYRRAHGHRKQMIGYKLHTRFGVGDLLAGEHYS